MSIKERLFGKPWEHKDPALRARAVAESDDPRIRAELGHMAEHDDSAEVRLAALRRINTEPFWLDARLRESDPAILESADRFLLKAVMKRADDQLIKERLEWFRRIEDADFVRKAASHAPDRSLRAEALARIDSPGFMGDRIVEEPDDELALSLIDRIDQRSTLERILVSLRRRSKRRASAVERRLHELQSASGEYDAAAESAARLVERAERLARGDFDGDRREERDQLDALWKDTDAPPDALARRFQGAMEIVHRSLEAKRRSAAEGQEPAQSTETPADASLTRAVDALEAVDVKRDVRNEDAARLLGEFDRAWQAIDQPSAADEALRDHALPIVRRLQKSHQSEAASSKEPPRKESPSEDTTDWSSELDSVAERIEAGEIAPAQSGIRELRSRFDRLKPKQRPRGVSGRLNRLEGRLREMRNWEHWSNNEHRDALIERVERLADSDQHPDAISAALKEARREWQHLEDLEVLPGDKRRHAAPLGQWRRFQAACKQAFEQAQPFFEKRHEVQAENLEQLEAFLERADELAASEDPDIDPLKQFLRSARLAIRRLDDLPPKSRGRAAARLREVMDALSSRLDSAFESIETAKRGLIREAQALQHEPDLKSAIEKAKALQARWQQAGTGRRKIEQQLWKEFRAPIDPLFEKLRGERDQQREAKEAETAAMKALVEQAEELAGIADDELEQAEGRMKSLRAEWQSAGRRPGHLVERFEKAERKLEKRLEARQLAERRRTLEQLDGLADQVQSAWQARQSGQKPAFDAPEIDNPDEATQSLLDAGNTVIDTEVADETLAERVTANGAEARQVLIEMEFLSGLDSPPEDRDARMNFQVERLAQRMSERDQAPGLAEELGRLRQRWYASFPHPIDSHDAMANRFRKCQNVLESMSGTE